MRYSPLYIKGHFIQICEEFFIEFNGNIPELCKIAKLPLITFYSWYATDEDFRNVMRYFEMALQDKSKSSLHSIINDENAPLKYRLTAYQIIYPEQKESKSDDSDSGSFSLNLTYNGSPINECKS